MQILHGTWIPDLEADFIQAGRFYLWIETTERQSDLEDQGCYPLQLTGEALARVLSDEFKLRSVNNASLSDWIEPCYFLLPTVEYSPLPSLELSRYLEISLPEAFEFEYWEVDAYPVECATPSKNKMGVMGIVPLLNELHFLALHSSSELQLGSDLLFWFHFTQALKRIIFKDHYIPSIKYRLLSSPEKTNSRTYKKADSGRSSRRKKVAVQHSELFKLYAGWEFVGEGYESLLEHYVEYMPLLCAAGFNIPHEEPQFYERRSLLQHFSECLLHDVVTHTRFTQAFEKTVADSVLADCLNSRVWTQQLGLELYQQWHIWRDRIFRTQTDQPFYLYFHLLDPANPDDVWQLQFEIAPKDDPSLKLSLADYWRMGTTQQKEIKKHLGSDFEQSLLLNLGYACRIYPALWQGLETDQPVGIQLALREAFTFLKESAWVLENAGYKVLVPAWWTPQGRQRAKVRLKAKGKSLSGGEDKSKSYFSLDRLVEYQYELAIGDEPVSEQEWYQLVNAKTPLVQFRGQWIELDQDKMQQMLEFWKTHQAENPELSLLDFMKLTATGENGELEVTYSRKDILAEMLNKLSDKSKLQPVDDPDNFAGQLRAYQKRGVSWLQYLEELGLNGCLADDMGLGKTVQVIARLVQERESGTGDTDSSPLPPTLLIAPTSVVGNWRREIHKFAPHITSAIHHGADRAKETKAFKQLCREHDIVITSFALARRDAKLFNAVKWHRIVLDEAQNIKNPKAALTKAICKFSAAHRLALTGTPIENRLLDLWSIFHFLNPGYLGNQTQFRKKFEVPIQKHSNPRQSATLKKLVEPFILRRVKTDQSIIKDLPDKVEQKLFCNLTKEQASLYEAVVKDVEQKLESADEGIQRKGLILATLTKLKQVCNHPRQFLQDDSEFTAARSHKLTRLTEMIEEARAEQDSLLVFTQFTELGHALERYIRQTFHCNTYYLHGGTSQKKREAMIAEFQDPETEPSVFVLSLKAGGVGITLTKANHVFHFDRWWNPSVENQASDRAFRIGQKKNVFVHKFVAVGTLEERIDEMIEDKKKLAGAIVGADESWLTELDNDAFRQLISLNKTAIME